MSQLAHTSSVLRKTRTKVLSASLIALAVIATSLGIVGYRRYNVCVTHRAQLQKQVQHLESDAREQLKVGTKKTAVARFFEEHGMPSMLGYGTVLGEIHAQGCAPALVCGRDDVTIVVSVKVDAEGTVIGEPHVSSIYEDCL